MLGDNVKKIRESNGLSQSQFAKKCNFSRATVYDLESKRVANPRYSQICKICMGMKITPNDLIPKEDYT